MARTAHSQVSHTDDASGSNLKRALHDGAVTHRPTAVETPAETVPASVTAHA